jgi:uncharacterized DUF497 family protein
MAIDKYTFNDDIPMKLAKNYKVYEYNKTESISNNNIQQILMALHRHKKNFKQDRIIAVPNFENVDISNLSSELKTMSKDDYMNCVVYYNEKLDLKRAEPLGTITFFDQVIQIAMNISSVSDWAVFLIRNDSIELIIRSEKVENDTFVTSKEYIKFYNKQDLGNDIDDLVKLFRNFIVSNKFKLFRYSEEKKIYYGLSNNNQTLLLLLYTFLKDKCISTISLERNGPDEYSLVEDSRGVKSYIHLLYSGYYENESNTSIVNDIGYEETYVADLIQHLSGLMQKHVPIRNLFIIKYRHDLYPDSHYTVPRSGSNLVTERTRMYSFSLS